jgi:ribonuclease P protein component
MLPAINRLCLKTELKKVKQKGRFFPGQFFSLISAVSLSQVSPRFAFIISKRVAPKAFQRNKAKRLLAEAVYFLLPRIKPGVKGVFLVKKKILGQNLEMIKKETEKIFRESNLVNEKTTA